MRCVACGGRYCPCRRHLDADLPQWVLDDYLPSPWAMEILHRLWVEGRGRDEVTDDERAVLIGELLNLGDAATGGP